ncbi:hypothetical protein GRJ2_000993100 [Grus japonensis]|uniref:Uncharacterized protein n=1 Tax=Grus japonensis TaxID=30415 RepID=A0ABC9WII1_GRUJA
MHGRSEPRSRGAEVLVKKRLGNRNCLFKTAQIKQRSHYHALPDILCRSSGGSLCDRGMVEHQPRSSDDRD